jgi:hypothetical protein
MGCSPYHEEVVGVFIAFFDAPFIYTVFRFTVKAQNTEVFYIINYCVLPPRCYKDTGFITAI